MAWQHADTTPPLLVGVQSAAGLAAHVQAEAGWFEPVPGDEPSGHVPQTALAVAVQAEARNCGE